MTRVLAAALFLFLIVGSPVAASAQAPDPVVISGSVPISAELRAQIEAYLAESPPSSASYYAPTYVQANGQYTLVSLAAANLASPDDPLLMESNETQTANVVWIGTIRINADGSGSQHSVAMRAERYLPKLAAPRLRDLVPGPGGGTYVRLPFATGKAMQYGVRGIHGAGDYGTSGMRAVDLVGGTGLGNNVAGPMVYASAAGTIDYVCTDDYQAAIRTYNAATDDYFLYVHMYDNASLEMDHVFSAGATIGSLRSGTFTDTCGWTEQGDNVYHDHWMFEPSGGAFRVGAYSINIGDGKFHTSTNVYATGAWISNSGTPLSGTDDPIPSSGGNPSFWDPIVAGIVNAAAGAASRLPPPTTVTILHVAANAISLTFRLTWILVRGNLNLTLPATILVIVITMRVAFSVPWVALWVMRVLRVIKQLFSPLG